MVYFVSTVSSENFKIDTNEPPSIQSSSNQVQVSGSLQEKTFTGPNGATWKHKVASFVISDAHKHIFNDSNNLEITGNNSLSLNVTGNFELKTLLDVSGRSVEGLSSETLFVVGGFVRSSNSCCVLGR